MSEYFFSPLSLETIDECLKSSLKFNFSLPVLEMTQIKEVAFDTNNLGGAAQKVDIYTVRKGICTPIESCIDLSLCRVEDEGCTTYNMKSILHFLNSCDIAFDGLLMITRIQSNFVLDKVKWKIYSEYYSICDKETGDFLEMSPSVNGYLAKRGIIVRTMKDVREFIKKDYEDNYISEYSYLKYTSLLGNMSL